MMRMSGIKMKTRIDREELLGKLRDNLRLHAKVVTESRHGYFLAAEHALVSRLQKLRESKDHRSLVNLHFDLTPPTDHSEVYKTAISMLEWSKEKTVELEADEFRRLVLDEWDWMDEFLMNNRRYSDTATKMSEDKGL